jgi:hypothetical protein
VGGVVVPELSLGRGEQRKLLYCRAVKPALFGRQKPSSGQQQEQYMLPGL